MYSLILACRPAGYTRDSTIGGLNGPSTPYASFSIPAGGFDPRKDMLRQLSGDSFTAALSGHKGQMVERHVSISVPDHEPADVPGPVSAASPYSPSDLHEPRYSPSSTLGFFGMSL